MKSGKVPLFPLDQTHLIYPFVTAKLYAEGLVVNVPLTQRFKFQWIRFIPFPTCTLDGNVILTHEKTELLMDSEKLTYVESSKEDLEHCKTSFNLTVCDIEKFNTVKQSESCLSELKVGKEATRCTYDKAMSKLRVTTVDSAHIVYNPEGSELTITCSDAGHVSTECSEIIPVTCSIMGQEIKVQKSVTHVSRVHKTLKQVKNLTLPKAEVERFSHERIVTSVNIAIDYTALMLASVSFIVMAGLLLSVCRKRLARKTSSRDHDATRVKHVAIC